MDELFCKMPCCGRKLSAAEVLSLAGSIRAAMRKNPGRNGGRKRLVEVSPELLARLA